MSKNSNEVEAAGRAARPVEETAPLAQCVNAYLTHLHSAEPLGDTFKLLKARVITAACQFVRGVAPRPPTAEIRYPCGCLRQYCPTHAPSYLGEAPRPVSAPAQEPAMHTIRIPKVWMVVGDPLMDGRRPIYFCERGDNSGSEVVGYVSNADGAYESMCAACEAYNEWRNREEASDVAGAGRAASSPRKTWGHCGNCGGHEFTVTERCDGCGESEVLEHLVGDPPAPTPEAPCAVERGSAR